MRFSLDLVRTEDRARAWNCQHPDELFCQGDRHWRRMDLKDAGDLFLQTPAQHLGGSAMPGDLYRFKWFGEGEGHKILPAPDF